MSVLASLVAIRKQMMEVWPEDCCEKTTITQGTATGEKETVPACRNDCKWQEMARVLALAEIDVEQLEKWAKLCVKDLKIYKGLADLVEEPAPRKK